DRDEYRRHRSLGCGRPDVGGELVGVEFTKGDVRGRHQPDVRVGEYVGGTQPGRIVGFAIGDLASIDAVAYARDEEAGVVPARFVQRRDPVRPGAQRV